MFEFKTLDIKPETTVEEANDFMRQNDIVSFFVMDITQNHKRIWVTIRKNPFDVKADDLMKRQMRKQ